jgi:hypothetical protein
MHTQVAARAGQGSVDFTQQRLLGTGIGSVLLTVAP